MCKLSILEPTLKPSLPSYTFYSFHSHPPIPNILRATLPWASVWVNSVFNRRHSCPNESAINQGWLHMNETSKGRQWPAFHKGYRQQFLVTVVFWVNLLWHLALTDNRLLWQFLSPRTFSTQAKLNLIFHWISPVAELCSSTSPEATPSRTVIRKTVIKKGWQKQQQALY